MASLQLLSLLRSPWLLEAVTGLGAAGTCREGQASWGRQGHFEAVQQPGGVQQGKETMSPIRTSTFLFFLNTKITTCWSGSPCVV